MGQSSNQLLIAIPTKTSPHYFERAKTCEATWLKDSPFDYKFFRDSDLGLDEQDLLVRQKRMKRMCQYAFENGYEFLMRADSDAYIWLDRFAKTNWSEFDAWSYYGDEPTTYAATGYTLSRRAMELVIDAEHFRPTNDVWQGREEWYGDLWVGKLLVRAGIKIGHNPRAFDKAERYARIKDVPGVETLIGLHKLTIPQMLEYAR